jgi:exopolyphosphatase/guanosine-5'-triphosphate,3'-diphosphate pyrophosphatase
LKFAAIDIGSNSIKLVVVEAAASDSFAVLVREREVVRLGHETLLKGHLDRGAILRATECIRRFRSIAEARGAQTIVATATAAVREANNSANFIKAVEQKTGIKVEILSGIEEARLIGLAASHGCGAKGVPTLNIDIGGGSTEISIFRDGLPTTLLSIKLGAVGLTERFLTSDPPRAKAVEALRTEIRAALERPARELRDYRWENVTGTSGTILSIGNALRLQSAGEQTVQPIETKIKLRDLTAFNLWLVTKTVHEKKIAARLTLPRAEIIVAGGLVLEGVMRALEIKSLSTCEWGLREGVIIDRLRDWEAQSRPPMPDIADQKLRGVHAVGRRFGYEEAHSHQVARLAETIFDALSPSANLTRHQRLLLSAAALLHDVGYHIAHESHHKHSFYLIENSELTGFSESERAVIANVARYHKGSLPKDRHPNYAALSPADRATVARLAGILRLADAMDRRHDNRVNDLNCRRTRNVFHIQATSTLECEHELTEAGRRLKLFENAFQCKLKLRWQRAVGEVRRGEMSSPQASRARVKAQER